MVERSYLVFKALIVLFCLDINIVVLVADNVEVRHDKVTLAWQRSRDYGRRPRVFPLDHVSLSQVRILGFVLTFCLVPLLAIIVLFLLEGTRRPIANQLILLIDVLKVVRLSDSRVKVA